MVMVRGLSERIETCEHSLVEKDKEISYLKFTINEMQTKHKDFTEQLRGEMTGMHENVMKQFNAELDVLKEKNQNLEKEMACKEERSVSIEKDLAVAVEKIETLLRRVDAAEALKNNQDIDNIVKKIDVLETKVNLLEANEKSGCEIDRASNVLKKASGARGVDTGAVKPKRNTVMQVFKQHPASKVVRSGDNTVDFKRNWSIITLPGVIITKGMKAWYEVQVLKLSRYRLDVGWCCKEGHSKENFCNDLGSNSLSYCFTAGNVCYSFKQHAGKMEFWGRNIKINDVIGVAYDAVKGQILFSLNGQWNQPFGIAFADIDTNIGLFPAISLSNGKIQVNYGEKDFLFGPPDDSYMKLVDI